ncbi:Polysaccharide biosynthesis/export protein [Posidoniimonas polymericola]|uniref:Polysaccharide biosynthesis/export protein n=1 Tax=Posidoniimonas polymericola TaxID=2528002 RepID=A0A5C5YTH5_9BACT|nr:polysaccharide biosynthesis/export family protein [Posidoniimonas polymericola]TWT78258.1 Polysaccharide biosynthesis/export protein [Posidoniimonas polymericola]
MPLNPSPSLRRLLTPRFSLKSMLVLVLGIAIGYSLNVYTLQVLLGYPSEGLLVSLPEYVVEPPDVVTLDVVADAPDELTKLQGEHLVGPDGRIVLGEFGSVYVTGLTLEEAQAAIEKQLGLPRDGAKTIALDVFAYNSKRFFVISKNPVAGDSITQLPITGNDTVLDALAQMGGSQTADAKIYISRPSAKGNGAAAVLPVNYEEVLRGVTRTNYQLLPGDRLFVEPPTKPMPAPRGLVTPVQPPAAMAVEQAERTS